MTLTEEKPLQPSYSNTHVSNICPVCYQSHSKTLRAEFKNSILQSFCCHRSLPRSPSPSSCWNATRLPFLLFPWWNCELAGGVPRDRQQQRPALCRLCLEPRGTHERGDGLKKKASESTVSISAQRATLQINCTQCVSCTWWVETVAADYKHPVSCTNCTSAASVSITALHHLHLQKGPDSEFISVVQHHKLASGSVK